MSDKERPKAGTVFLMSNESGELFSWRAAYVGAAIVGGFIIVGELTGAITGLDSIMGIIGAVLGVLMGGVIGGFLRPGGGGDNGD